MTAIKNKFLWLTYDQGPLARAWQIVFWGVMLWAIVSYAIEGQIFVAWLVAMLVIADLLICSWRAKYLSLIKVPRLEVKKIVKEVADAHTDEFLRSVPSEALDAEVKRRWQEGTL